MITECNNDDITILQGRTGHEVHSAELVMVILYPANLRRIMILFIKNSRINKSLMLILLLQKCFQLALLLTHSFTILRTAGITTDSLCLAIQ